MQRSLLQVSRALAVASALAAIALTACDPFPDPSYPGTPIAELEVTVTDIREVSSGPLLLTVAWYRSADPGDWATEWDEEINPPFPATIKFPIYVPPPLTVLSQDALPTEFQLGVGFLTVWEPGAEGPAGLNAEHFVIYAPADVPEGSFASLLLDATPEEGFHIAAPRQLDPDTFERRETCFDGLVTPLTWQDVYGTCGGHPHYPGLDLLETGLATPLSIELSEKSAEDPDSPLWLHLNSQL